MSFMQKQESALILYSLFTIILSLPLSADVWRMLSDVYSPLFMNSWWFSLYPPPFYSLPQWGGKVKGYFSLGAILPNSCNQSNKLFPSLSVIRGVYLPLSHSIILDLYYENVIIVLY